ncbi:unnamed protein product [Closterium sp. Yama58-4]|nr:unnamed protein product [Closterium sp. Yama58-4]
MEEDHIEAMRIPREAFDEPALDITDMMSNTSKRALEDEAAKMFANLQQGTTFVSYLNADREYKEWCCACLKIEPTEGFQDDAILLDQDEALHIIRDIASVSTELKFKVKGQEDSAGPHFLRTLRKLGRKIVAQDLAMMLYKTPYHPYVQASSLCRNTEFRKWAHDVFHTQEKASKERRNPTETTEARAAGTCPPSDVSGQSPPPDQGAPKVEPQQPADVAYEKDVVAPWRKCQSVEHAWVLWNLQGRGDKRRLRDRYGKDTCFVKRHSYDGGSKSVGGITAQMRRVKRVMDAVEALGETTQVRQKLESILGRTGGWSTFADGIGVVKMPGKVEPDRDDGLEGFTSTQHDQLKVGRMLVESELRTEDWLKKKFPTTWDKSPAPKPQKAKAPAKKRQKVANT